VEPQIRTYFIDESGDGVLFDAKGRVKLGTDGSLKHFYLGLADVQHPEALTAALTDLRTRLMADPYFRNVPSMQPSGHKTAALFHAKDDLPEVRREVFALLVEHNIRFLAEIKRMDKVLAYVRYRNETDPVYRYRSDELYEHMTRRLLKNTLHKEERYRVVFARRGSTTGGRALADAIDQAQRKFCEERGITTVSEIEVVSAFSRDHGGLQAADYFLWALQRYWERGEERYLAFLLPKVSLIHDIDDIREAAYGRYYTRKKPPLGGSSKMEASDIEP
jgi:hypothetical protein